MIYKFLNAVISFCLTKLGNNLIMIATFLFFAFLWKN